MRYALLPLLLANVLSAAVITPLTSRPNATPDPDTYMIPHIVDGGFWKTSFKFVNLETHSVTFYVYFVDDNGNDLSLPIVGNGSISSFTVTLPATGSTTIETAGTASSLTAGWAFVQQQTATDNIGKFAIFRQHVPGGQDQEATVPAVKQSTGDIAILFDNTTYATGIAIANPTIFTIEIGAHFYNRLGALIGTSNIRIPPKGHVAFSVASQFPFTSGMEGSIEFSNIGRAYSALGLRFNGAAFTTFDVFAQPQWLTQPQAQ
jgi:hypothetical protein